VKSSSTSHRRHTHVQSAITRRCLLPAVDHRRGGRSAQQDLVHPPPDAVDRAEEPAIDRGARLSHLSQQHGAKLVVVIVTMGTPGQLAVLAPGRDGRGGGPRLRL